jgi:hypothetical protein
MLLLPIALLLLVNVEKGMQQAAAYAQQHGTATVGSRGAASAAGGKAAAAGATTAPLPLLNAPEAAEKGEERLRATT